MPSTKNPNPTVDPGPGHLPADTVSVDALTFDIGSSTSLDVHVVDPTGAHAATAISTLALSGETWSFPAGDTQGALARAYQGLNARAFWVLDAAGNSDADFKGAGALNQAVTAFIASTRKPALYLRAGTYTWTHPGNNTALNNVRIVGASGLAIVNATTFAVGASTVLESVSLNATTTVTLSGGSATLRRVVINTVTLSNSSAKNVLEDVTVSATGAITLSGLSLSCSGTALTSTSTITQSGNGASIKGGPWAGTTITVSGNDNVFLGVPFTGTTALGGTNNTYLTFGASVGLTVGGASGAGVAPNFARSDHTHGLPAFGAAANTFCEGNDTRLQDTRPPNGPAGGGLTGTYPNPTVAAVPESVVRTSLAAVTADVDINSKKLVKVANPGAAQDAATKNYVDTGLSNGLADVAYRSQQNTFSQPQTISANIPGTDALTVTGHIVSTAGSIGCFGPGANLDASTDIRAGNNVTAGNNMTATGNVSGRNVSATNGNVTATGNIITNTGVLQGASASLPGGNGNLTAQNVYLRGNFQYIGSDIGTGPSRTVQVNLCTATGTGLTQIGPPAKRGGWVRIPGASTAYIPLRLPDFARLTQVRAKISASTGSTTMVLTVAKKDYVDIADNGKIPTTTHLGSATVTTSGVDWREVNISSYQVTLNETYWAVIENTGSNQFDVLAVDCTFTDPGPRNF